MHTEIDPHEPVSAVRRAARRILAVVGGVMLTAGLAFSGADAAHRGATVPLSPPCSDGETTCSRTTPTPDPSPAFSGSGADVLLIVLVAAVVIIAVAAVVATVRRPADDARKS